MFELEDGDFYKYISEHNGGYQIVKNNIHYGWYDDIRWALYDRDRLIECNWDLGEFVYLNETPNKYMYITLPPKIQGLKRPRQYVYCKNNGFTIEKTINGKKRYFGKYKTLDEALEKRNELMMNGWEDEYFK